MAESRVHKSVLNAKIGGLFYFLNLVISFVSRKIFLDNLGDEFIGLTGTLYNFIGFLSLSELGIGTAVAFNLYKPLREGDREKISGLISLFGYFFSWVGTFVGVAALILSAFFPFIFEESTLPTLLIYLTFYSFVSSSLITYFLNYRQILLSADQRGYVVTGYFQSAFIVKTILQVVMAYAYQNLYVWVLLEFLFSWIACIIINWRINVTYPWLKVDLSKGRQLMKQYPQVIRSAKQVFVHSFKDFLVGRADQMLIFLYVSLDMVAHYGNYLLIITKSVGAFNTIMGGAGASIGNLVAEGNKQKILKVFWELVSLQLIIAGVLSVGFYFFMEPFIKLWLGEKYILPATILVLMICNNFMNKALETVKSFNHAYGNYGDVWVVWVEGGLFLVVTLLTAPSLGIVGILLGRLASLTFDLVWKPYYLFSAGIKESVFVFWKGLLQNVLIFGVSFAIVYFAYTKLDMEINNFFDLVFHASILVPVFTVLYVTLLSTVGIGGKDLISRLPFVKNFRK